MDKFGVLTARARGRARVSVYSWADAYPVAANVSETFSREGLQDSLDVSVLE